MRAYFPICTGLAAGLLAGCAHDVAMPQPQMPRILPAPAAPAEPAPPASELIAAANGALEAGDVAAAVHALGQLAAPEQRIAAGRELAARRTGQEPAAAARFAQALPPGAGQMQAMEAVGRAWAQRDADAAVRWATELSETTYRYTTLLAVADEVVSAGGRAALERIRAWPATPARDDALTVAAARWARRDGDAAIAWARELPAGELRTRVTASIGFELAQLKPRAALTVAESLPAGRDRALLYGAIGQTWFAQDSNAAVAWARGLPSGSERAAALAGIETGSGTISPRRGDVIRRGTRRIAGGSQRDRSADPLTLPQGLDRERAIERHLEELLLTSPALAANWLDQAPANERTDERLDRVARQWLRTNPAAAEAWIDQSVVLRERKRQLLREVGR